VFKAFARQGTISKAENREVKDPIQAAVAAQQIAVIERSLLRTREVAHEDVIARCTADAPHSP